MQIQLAEATFLNMVFAEDCVANCESKKWQTYPRKEQKKLHHLLILVIFSLKKGEERLKDMEPSLLV